MRYPIFNKSDIKHTYHKKQIIKLLADVKISTHSINDLSKKYKFIPSARCIQENGGIVKFVNCTLGIPYQDARTGSVRSAVALNSNKRAMYQEANMGRMLASKYGERNVHWQSPYNKECKSLCRSDFKVFRDNGTHFYIDLFYACDAYSFAGCVNIKLRKLANINVDGDIFFVSCSPDVLSAEIKYYIDNKKKRLPHNINIITIEVARALF